MFRYALIILILFFSTASEVSSFEELELNKFNGSDYTILFEEPLHNAIADVVRIYPIIKADLEEKLALKVGFSPTIMLIHTDSAFSRMVRGNDLITAFALPDRKSMIIDYSKMLKNPFNLELTMKHELAHLLLHDYIDGSNLPKWLDEGICQWVSNGIADIIQFDGKKLLKQTALSGRYISLYDISHGFPREPELLKLSYEESRDFVEYLVKRFGDDRFLALLEELHNGDNIDSASVKALSVDIYTLEKEWHASLKRRYTWFIYFSNNISWLIFVFGAIVAFIGYVKLRIRMKTHFKDDDDDGDYELYDGREEEEVKPWER